MDKKRVEIIITAVLTVVLILAVINSMKTVKNKLKPPAAAALAQPSQQPSAALMQKMAPKKQQGAPEILDWLRCPFSGKVYSASGKSVKLKLTGILWDEKMPQALISDSIVKKGDSVGNYIVVKINKNSVVLNDGTKDIELTVGQ